MIAAWLRTEEEEVLDREAHSERGRAELAELDRWNRLTGWYRFHVARAREHWIALGRPRPFRVLDVGTGQGGLLAALCEWGEAEGVEIEAVGVDRSAAFAEQSQARLAGRARVMCADATALPFDAGTFDLATNTLMMHHCPLALRRALVAEMARVCRSAYVFDVEVTLYGVVGWTVVARLLGFNPDTRRDGALSVRRGSTYAEFAELVRPLPVKPRRAFPSAMCTVPL